jgi:hypothetical protein
LFFVEHPPILIIISSQPGVFLLAFFWKENVFHKQPWICRLPKFSPLFDG